MDQPEPEAQELALELELFTDGSLNAFAHKTNVDTQNRMVVYDIMDLGKQLKTMGLLVITDAMNMKAITGHYNSDKAAVLAVTAGADVILMPADYTSAYNGLLKAVQDGTITEERIDESVNRIVRAKLLMEQQ